jgi:hypothetical protein
MHPLVAKVLLYGAIGLLIEVIFTGLWSVASRNWKASGHTYLWMWPVYGLTALVLEAVSEALPWPFYLKALVYLPVIYGAEALSGATIKLVTTQLQRWLGGHGGGVILWDYGSSRWTPFGLINFKYAPAWFFVGLVFDPISGMMRNVVNYLAKVQ